VSAIPDACAPCRSGDPPLSDDEVARCLAEVPRWTREGAWIARRFELPDFRAALAWINRVGMLAEQHEHHPDVHLTGWNHVELRLSTHAIGGLSLNDFVLARDVDRLARRDGRD
jgi:4a-hydroxytetrahydrobiopterin dehydratase